MRIPGIYVSIRGDSSKLDTDLKAARAKIRSQARDMSDALNNALSPGQISKGLGSLTTDLASLSRLAKRAKSDFAGLGVSIEESGKLVGLNSDKFKQLQSRALQTMATKQAEQTWSRLQDSLGASSLQMATLRARMGDLTGAAKQFEAAAVAGFVRVKSAVFSVEAGLTALGVGFAVYEAGSYAKHTALLAARYGTLGTVMETVGGNAGYSATEMRKYDKILQDSGIAAVESRQTLAQLVQAHIDLAQASKLARLAQDAAVIGNINSSEAFQRLVFGIQSAQVEVLRGIGLNVNFENSYKKFAEQVGKTANSLTEQEKMQARVNAVMEKASDIAGVYEAALDTAGKKLSSLPRHLQRFELSLGKPMLGATAIIVDEVTRSLDELTKHVQDPSIQTGLEGIATSFAGVVRDANDWLLDIDKTDLERFSSGLGNVATGITSIASSVGQLAGSASQLSPDVLKLLLGGGLAYKLTGAAGGTAYALNWSFEQFNKGNIESLKGYDVGSISDSYWQLNEAMNALLDVMAGQRDWDTGVWLGDSAKAQANRVKEAQAAMQAAVEGGWGVRRVAYDEETNALELVQTKLDLMRERVEELNSTPIQTAESQRELDWLKTKIMDAENKVDALDGRNIHISTSVDMSAIDAAAKTIEQVLSGTTRLRARTLAEQQSQLDDVKALAASRLKEVSTQIATAEMGGGDISDLARQYNNYQQMLDDVAYGYRKIGYEQEKNRQAAKTEFTFKSGGGRGKKSGGSQLSNQLQRAREQALSLQAALVGETFQGKLDAISRRYDSMVEKIKGASGYARQLREQLANNKGLETQLAYQEALREQAKFTAQQLQEIGAASGNAVLMREGWQADLKNWEDEQLRAIKSIATSEGEYADLAARTKEQRYWKEIEYKKQTAKDFQEYLAALDASDPKTKFDTKIGIWGQVADAYKHYSDEMRMHRLSTYDAIIQAATKAGQIEKQMIAEVLQEAEKLDQLQFFQQYGTADQAFNATLSINFGTYKSELTKAREFAVTEAEAISQLFNDLGGSITGSFSSIVDGLIDGTMTVEDALADLTGNVADAFMNCFSSIFQAWLQNQIGSILNSVFGLSSSFGGGISSLASMFTFAQGGAFESAPGLSAYSNSVVSSPTMFAFASGAGIMGEAGPEAIMPLTRMPGGNLGVEAKPSKPESRQEKPNIDLSVKNITLFDPGLIGQWAKTDEGEKVIMNIVRRNS